MKDLLLSLFLILLTFILNGQDYLKSIDEIVEQHINAHSFSGNVLIADRGKVVYRRSHGLADEAKETPIHQQTKFMIASVTKMLTAIVILQLVEEGGIRLDQNLKELLPQFNIKNAHKITIHHLLLHISGLPYQAKSTYLQKLTPTEIVNISLDSKTKKNKLDQFSYNNLDYILLGLIVEKYNQTSWQAAIEARILEPLNLNNTGFLKKGNLPEDFAFTYSFNKEGKKQKDPSFFIENFYAAGCMYSTVDDLLKIDQGLYTNNILSEASQKIMYKSYPEHGYVGYSVWTYTYPFTPSKPKIVERRGGVLGANLVVVRLIDTQKTILILSNNNGFNPDSFGDDNNLREALIRIFAEASPVEIDEDYLAIRIEQANSKHSKQLIFYPKGTTYELNNGAEALRDKELEINGMKVYQGDFSITIFPEYAPEDPVKYHSDGGRVRIFTTNEAYSTFRKVLQN